jgi:hypothetical protein
MSVISLPDRNEAVSARLDEIWDLIRVTLGGLVEAGRRLGDHLRQALETGRLCSNDPVCADHYADDTNERRF